MKEDVEDWYQNRRTEYEQVQARLDSVRRKFMSDRGTAKRMLTRSYVNAVMSIQTPVERHERAYAQWIGGQPLYDATAITAYGEQQKPSWIISTLKHPEWFEHAVDLLYDRRIDDAHTFLREHFSGLSWRKAGFALAMLGFTSRMCVDTNVKQCVETDVDIPQDWNSLDAYSDACERIVGLFDIPEDPFVVQWALFDWQRGEHTDHSVWFDDMFSL